MGKLSVLIKGNRGILPIVILVSLFFVSIWGILHLPVASAQTGTGGERICRAAMVIDRSGSVGPWNLEILRNQIRRLFQPTGLYDNRIQLAFWTFSSSLSVDNSTGIGGGFAWIGVPPSGSNPDPNYHPRNFNAPYHSYVSSRGETPSTFNTMLNSIVSSGSTNYQQAFGYNGDVRNPALNDVFNQTDIIVFMTDGQPNAGGGWGVSATEAGRIAAQKHVAAGKTIIGGSIGANVNQRRTINYVVSGDYNNNNSSFVISSNYDDLAEVLKREIGEACGNLYPPTPCQYNADIPSTDPRCVAPALPYSLIPSVGVNGSVVSSAENVNFTYRVTNNSSSNPSQDSGWSVKRLVVSKGQSTDPLGYDSTQSYRDGYSCQALINLVGGPSRATCEDAASGTKVFPQGTSTNLISSELNGTDQAQIQDEWEVGTKLCYVLAIDRPTENDSPVNRFSRAACVVVGKKPSVQVHGDDIIVGRQYRGDGSTSAVSNARIQTSITAKAGSINRSFGSWGEYGAFAPGPINGFASASGLQGGVSVDGADIRTLSSRLTFANRGGELGYFSQEGAAGSIPDSVAYLTRSREVVGDLATVNNWSASDKADGLYRKASGDLRLDAGVVQKGRMVVVHVPNGTVTIAGNQQYESGGYRSLAELPQLVVIAKNIVIDGSVSNVDAWLIAKQTSDGTGGVVSTCDVMTGLTSEVCNTPLMINGPVMSTQLSLLRTGGAGVGAESDTPAEIFNLRPSVYLWAYAEGRGELRVETTYTTELPPRF